MKAIKGVLMMPNLGVAVFDEAGEQIPELQRSFPVLFAELCERNGYDPTDKIIGTPLGKFRIIRTEDRWNWENA